jgi:protein-L-isoaspartate O-methyltransferase
MGNPAFTGERFLPDCTGEIAYEHWHRYVFARHLAADKTVLDVATGDGYGAALLSGVAEFVCGVDIDPPTVQYESATYAAHKNLAFIQADS